MFLMSSDVMRKVCLKFMNIKDADTFEKNVRENWAPSFPFTLGEGSRRWRRQEMRRQEI